MVHIAEGEGARQGSRPQRPVSPLLPREVDHFLPPFFFFNGRKYDLCSKWRLTTIHLYSLPHSLFNSLVTEVQDISNHIPQSINICLFLDAEKSIFNFFFNFREYFYLFCNLFTLAKLQRGLEKKPQGEDRVHPWD